jgi:hypothetical protein
MGMPGALVAAAFIITLVVAGGPMVVVVVVVFFVAAATIVLWRLQVSYYCNVLISRQGSDDKPLNGVLLCSGCALASCANWVYSRQAHAQSRRVPWLYTEQCNASTKCGCGCGCGCGRPSTRTLIRPQRLWSTYVVEEWKKVEKSKGRVGARMQVVGGGRCHGAKSWSWGWQGSEPREIATV